MRKLAVEGKCGKLLDRRKFFASSDVSATYARSNAAVDLRSLFSPNWLVRHVGKWWKRYLDRRARQATIMVLQSLDGRTLKDIGVNRAEIVWLVDNMSDKPSRSHITGWPFTYKY
jgi:uncharacterized protein YjiS (DUF1127 family)